MADNKEPAPVRNVFTVLDPTRMIQPALDKAEWVAERNKAKLQLYCCVYDTHLAFQRESQDAAVELAGQWLERLAARARDKGLEVSITVESSPDWRDAIAAAATASRCDLIVKTTSLHGPVTRRLMKTADWTLIRRCPSPVLLVNPIQSANTKVVLAAVKLKPADEVHIGLNEQVVDMSHRIAGVLGAELHAVTVYRGDDVFFDRQQFADRCRLPRNRVHATEGAVHRGIAEIAAKIGAGVIIVGNAAGADRPGKTEDAARLVIDEMRTSDIIVLPVADDS
jgi:universal stress protein E